MTDYEIGLQRFLNNPVGHRCRIGYSDFEFPKCMKEISRTEYHENVIESATVQTFLNGYLTKELIFDDLDFTYNEMKELP